MKLTEIENKTVLILGFGREGQDTYRFLRRLFPKKMIAIGDRTKILDDKTKKLLKKDKFIKLYSGKGYLRAVKKYEVIIKSPGIPSKELSPFLTKKQKLTSQTEIFFDNFRRTIVGITGTKGKGTTASLAYKILKAGGLNVKLAGNIGKPVLNFLKNSKKNDVFILELSSFQLENLRKSPHIAVFLNLYPAHLDHHKTFKNYKKAKENITLHQTEKDFFIYNAQDYNLLDIAKKSKALKIGLKIAPQKSPITNFQEAYLKSGWLFWGSEKIIQRKDVPLFGDFNILNVLAAVSIAKIFNIPNSKIKSAIKSYKPLPHRLEKIGAYKGIIFINDSLATVPESVVSALDALNGKVDTLIIGGNYVKGTNIEKLAKAISSKNISNLIFLVKDMRSKLETAPLIYRYVKKTNSAKKMNFFFVSEMKEAVKTAYQHTKKQKFCLLSPGAPSFNLFKDYKERGNLFKKFVKLYGKKT
jgi:UDP-N-acetylmuramoylalanine--D-glutamate ligase